MILFKKAWLVALFLCSVNGLAVRPIDASCFFLQFKNKSLIHTVTVTFIATPPHGVVLKKFPTEGIHLVPGSTSENYQGKVYGEDYSSSFKVRLTGDDNKICDFEFDGHDEPIKVGNGCANSGFIEDGRHLLLFVQE